MTAALAVEELVGYLTPAERREFDALLMVPDYPRYREDPIAWMVERMHVPEHTLRWSLNPGYEQHVWDGTPDPLVAICDGLARWQDVGVESGTGTQKTYTAALLGLWFLDCFEDSIVVTIAPRAEQLKKHLWKNISKLWPRFHAIRPTAELTTLRIQMRPGSDVWAIYGMGTGARAEEESATKAQGEHAEHQFYLVEETPGVDDAILTAVDNTCTAPHNPQLRVGQPDHQLDALHRFCERPSVVHVRMSALDHPNVVTGDANIVPGAASRIANQKRLETYGEQHPLYQSRTRGISPAQAADALIRREWLEAAVKRGQENPDHYRRKGPRALGHDVANSESGDFGSLAFGEGALLERVESHRVLDASEFARMHIAPLIGPGMSAARVGVDSVGVGASAVNELKRLGKLVVSLAGGPMPNPLDENEYNTLRSQMHWAFAQELFHGEIALTERDEELFRDLLAPTWWLQNGKTVIEPKESLRDRLPGKRSPDKGDAAVYWNWVRKDRRPLQRLAMPSTAYVSVG